MKTILLIITLLFSFAASATKMTMNYKNLPCKQKVLPIKVEYDIRAGTAYIKITAEKDIDAFHVNTLRGIDGLIVTSSVKPETQNLAKGAFIGFEATFSKPEGLAYLVADIEGKVNSQLKKQPLPFPVGEVTKQQTLNREKNIKILPSFVKKTPKAPVQAKEEKFHKMKME